jgi:AcrR family transcriptional regulator
MEQKSKRQLGRLQWIEAALQALAQGGIAAVRVETLARRLRVTKGSFYWHFADRAALLEALLASWEQKFTRAIIDRVAAIGGSAEQRLATLFGLAIVDQGSSGSIELALRDWARHEPRVRNVLARVDRVRLRYLAGLLSQIGFPPVDARARALLLYSALLGEPVLAAGVVGTERLELLTRCLRAVTTR